MPFGSGLTNRCIVIFGDSASASGSRMDAAPLLPTVEPNQPVVQPPGLAPLAVIKSYEDLLAVVRSRMIALDITFETLDVTSGVQIGYSAKLLAGRTRRRFGNVSLPSVLGALGLQLVVLEDPAALARVHDRLTPRMRPRPPDP
jgi:hypothetical protein